MIKSRNFRNFHVCAANFLGEWGQISDRILLIWITDEHVEKFGDDLSSDLGD